MSWIVESGPLGLGVLVLAGLALAWVGLATGRPTRWWIDVWVAWACGLLTLGTLGTSSGLLVALAAVASTPAAGQSATLAAGLSIAARPLIIAVVGVVALALATGLRKAVFASTDLPARPPGYGLRLIGVAGLVAAATLPLIGLAVFAVFFSQPGLVPPAWTAAASLTTTGLSLFALLGYGLFVPVRAVVGWRSARSEGP